MVHTGVVLPADLLQRLKADGATSGSGLSGEIRQRLQASYDLDGLNPPTRQLIEDTRKLADSLALDIGAQWQENEFVRKALKAGFAVFLQEYDPKAERVADTWFRGHPDDAPHDVVGQTHARIILRARQGAVSK
jgi:hypothetical protein